MGARTMSPARAELIGGLEHEVTVMVLRIRRALGERARAVHPELQPSSYLMLSWLVDHGPRRASEIVEAFGIDKGAISRQVQHLVDLGLIDRSPDPADGRATLVSATPDAAERVRAVLEERHQRFDERLSDWSDDELSDVVALLGRYNAALG